jgi:predicted RNA methylase
MTLLPGLEGYAKRDTKLGQWDTHPDVCRAFVKWSGVREGDVVIEPCCGIGNLARAIQAVVGVRGYCACFEIDPERARVAKERLSQPVTVCDFLAREPPLLPEAHAALENPPYENDGESRFIEHSLKSAPRVCAIVRMVALASASRAPFWRSVMLARLAVLVPRPVFAGSSGMEEIVFVEVCRAQPGLASTRTSIEWLDWR